MPKMLPLSGPKPFYLYYWEKLTSPVLEVLKSGLTLESISMSFAIGITCGLFPIPGVTSLVGALFVWLLKANMIASTAINYVMTPFNLMCLVPFIRAGEMLFGIQTPMEFSMDEFSKSFFGALSLYGGALARACVVWLLLVGPTTFVLFHALKVVVRPFMKQQL